MRRLVCIILLGAALSLANVGSPGVHAHGGGRPQLTGAEAGDYRLYAWTSPDPWREGEVHVDVAVAQSANGEGEIPVMDADVRVHVSSAEGDHRLSLQARPLVYLNSFYYEIDFELPEPGTWQVEIEVVDANAGGSAVFAVEALPPREVNWLFLGGGIAALLGAAVLWAVWSRPSQTPASRKAQV